MKETKIEEFVKYFEAAAKYAEQEAERFSNDKEEPYIERARDHRFLTRLFSCLAKGVKMSIEEGNEYKVKLHQ